MAVIAINQQLGSRGAELGQLAAQELGYRFIGRSELIANASRVYNVDPEQFLILEERQPHFWERSRVDTVRLLSFIRATFFKEIAQDRVIFTSSSGAHLLPENGCGLRVRTVAAFKHRAARIAEVEALAETAAEKRVREHDREVRARQQTLYNYDIDDANIYHLVLNTSVIPLPALAASLKSCAEHVDRYADGEGWQQLRDAAIAAQVRAGLLSHPKFGHAQIAVECRLGAVQLNGPGLVPPWADLAREVAGGIEGVKSCEIASEEPPIPPRS